LLIQVEIDANCLKVAGSCQADRSGNVRAIATPSRTFVALFLQFERWLEAGATGEARSAGLHGTEKTEVESQAAEWPSSGSRQVSTVPRHRRRGLGGPTSTWRWIIRRRSKSRRALAS
jgi:hypothetical protein